MEPIIEYWYNGTKKKEYYLNASGQKDGKETIWWINGNKMSEIDYVNGLLHGKEIVWNENLNVIYLETDYVNGQKHGKEIRYYEENGNNYMNVIGKMKYLMVQENFVFLQRWTP